MWKSSEKRLSGGTRARARLAWDGNRMRSKWGWNEHEKEHIYKQTMSCRAGDNLRKSTKTWKNWKNGELTKKKRNQLMPFGIFFWPNRQISNTLAVISAVQAIPLSLLSCLSETNRELSATFKYAIIPASVGLVIQWRPCWTTVSPRSHHFSFIPLFFSWVCFDWSGSYTGHHVAQNSHWTQFFKLSTLFPTPAQMSMILTALLLALNWARVWEKEKKMVLSLKGYTPSSISTKKRQKIEWIFWKKVIFWKRSSFWTFHFIPRAPF